MKEPCSACRHNEVPAPNEPCAFCVKIENSVTTYTKFEAVPGKVVEVADGQQIPGLPHWKAIRFFRPSVAERLALKEAGIILDTRLADMALGKSAERSTGTDLFDVPGYESIASVLIRAYSQAAEGKGAERHGQGQPFDEQPMQQLIRLYGVGFALGQAAKKAQEAQRLPTVERQVAELLGAINYLAGAVIALELGKTEEDGRD